MSTPDRDGDLWVHAVAVVIHVFGLVLFTLLWRFTMNDAWGLGIGWCLLWGAAHTTHLRKILRKGVRL